ncbi:MAG: exopolyphosphatase [Phycisphaerae bacterium]|jgi:nanoRNase/pAp phosphatase (c-di-AMP/oligoRNAs hydrolase)|nr:exopolyphosphatase [Phycisphaerae bacterium]MDP7288210.1 exopolyphosphatase [Phycisphaerae bacterium]
MRLLTRSDFDGLACAALLTELGMVDEIKFVHPKDMQDGNVEVTANDVLANVPYVHGCGLWFDHHSSEAERQNYGNFYGVSDPICPSASRVIWNHYGGAGRFENPYLQDLVGAADKADSADFTIDEILNPSGWVLLSFVIDPRSGFGRYKDYRISNYQLMLDMIDYFRKIPLKDILRLSDVQERVTRYFQQDKLFREMVRENATVHDNVIVLDLRKVDEIYTDNRFMLYSLYPDQNISIRVMWGFQKRDITLACGHSVINRTSNTDIGSLMLANGGGGHKRVGTCQVPIEVADTVLGELIEQMNADGAPCAAAAEEFTAAR